MEKPSKTQPARVIRVRLLIERIRYLKIFTGDGFQLKAVLKYFPGESLLDIVDSRSR